MRIHLFEFEDLTWFPNSIREGGTDYLRYLLNAIGFYKPVAPLIYETLLKYQKNKIIDLCSGGGGNMEQVHQALSEHSNQSFSITLTDKFPNLEAYAFIKGKTKGKIKYNGLPVDACNVPKDLEGIRTLFSAVHHFKPEGVKAVLQNAVNDGAGIAIFDGGNKNILSILAILILHPIGFLLFTPFFGPFRFSRIFFTYFIPFIPLYTIWDGCVSILRLYHPHELLKLAQETEPELYTWKAGKVKSTFGLKVTFLVGYPVVQEKFNHIGA